MNPTSALPDQTPRMSGHGERIIRPVILSVVIAVPMGTLVHELGHGLTAVALGGSIDSLCVWPGVQLYPILQFHSWRLGMFGWCLTSDMDTAFREGMVSLMGSGSTCIVALLLVGLALLKTVPHRLAVCLLAMSVVFAWDIYLYSTLPLAGLQHAVFVGSGRPEPLNGALMMGLPRWTWFVLLGLHCLVYHSLFLWTLQTRLKHQTATCDRNGQLATDIRDV